MSGRSLGLDDELHRYLLEVSLREPEALARLRAETAGLAEASMQIAPEQGAFMRILVELLDVRRYLEIGVFTGYSALCVALAMAESGRITACDVSAEWTAVARRYWREAGVADKIDLRLGPALETLDALIAEGRSDSYDMVFIDADKLSYDDYYERALRLVRPGGLVLVDNVLWQGRVADAASTDAETATIRAFNAKLRDDERVTLSLLPLADGLTLARRRA